MTEAERREALAKRKARKLPWHSPPHLEYEGGLRFIVTAACYEHAHIIGRSFERMAECETEVLQICRRCAAEVYAWCILPNHYHLLLQTTCIKELRNQLGLLHGRSSFRWNIEDDQRGRKVWHNCFERPMKSERHFRVSLNYIHHNPVHHGYVKRWEDWVFSSASLYLQHVGREQAIESWKAYPILDYGMKWDV